MFVVRGVRAQRHGTFIITALRHRATLRRPDRMMVLLLAKRCCGARLLIHRRPTQPRWGLKIGHGLCAVRVAIQGRGEVIVAALRHGSLRICVLCHRTRFRIHPLRLRPWRPVGLLRQRRALHRPRGWVCPVRMSMGMVVAIRTAGVRIVGPLSDRGRWSLHLGWRDVSPHGVGAIGRVSRRARGHRLRTTRWRAPENLVVYGITLMVRWLPVGARPIVSTVGA